MRCRLLLVVLFDGPLTAGDGRVEGGGCVLRTQIFAGDGRALLVIDEDLVIRVSAIGRRADDLDAVALLYARNLESRQDGIDTILPAFFF